MFVVVALLGGCVDGFAMPRGCEKRFENKKNKKNNALSFAVLIAGATKILHVTLAFFSLISLESRIPAMC